MNPKTITVSSYNLKPGDKFWCVNKLMTVVALPQWNSLWWIHCTDERGELFVFPSAGFIPVEKIVELRMPEIPDYSTSETFPIHPDFPPIKPPKFIINKPMAISDIKIKWWDDGRQIHIKVEHDVPNGTAISVSAASLADALIALGNRLKAGKDTLHDEVWDDMRICGDVSIQFKELQ